jgi:hypothetical protein
MSGTIPTLLLHAFMTCIETIFTFTFYTGSKFQRNLLPPLATTQANREVECCSSGNLPLATTQANREAECCNSGNLPLATTQANREAECCSSGNLPLATTQANREAECCSSGNLMTIT